MRQPVARPVAAIARCARRSASSCVFRRRPLAARVARRRRANASVSAGLLGASFSAAGSRIVAVDGVVSLRGRDVVGGGARILPRVARAAAAVAATTVLAARAARARALLSSSGERRVGGNGRVPLRSEATAMKPRCRMIRHRARGNETIK